MPAPDLVNPEARSPAADEARLPSLLPLGLLAAGILLRAAQAWLRFLNPDEALHYLLSVQPSFLATYNATLTTAHPPLLIIWLHYWGMLGHSEFWLRLPSLLAGSGFCWIIFAWLRRVRDECTALIALVLLLYSPALVLLSSEVRQYPYLLLFCAGSLYSLDRAIEGKSAGWQVLSSLALFLALLTHYSSFIFAAVLGAYALARFISARPQVAVITVWAGAQIAAIAFMVFSFVHHISRLKSSGLTDVIAGTYLRRSVFQSGQDHVLSFIARANLRLFHYFFSQAAVGVIGILLFAAALVLLTREDSSPSRRPSSRQLAFLFALPLAFNCILAVFRLYPYGGTRHDSYLSIFILPAIAIALARWRPTRAWWRAAAIAIVLLLCNFFPSPQGEYIRLRNQRRGLMKQAMASLRSLPPEATIFTDDQGGLLLSYYLCGARVAQIEEQPFQMFMKARCGDKWAISLDPDLWIFKAETFPENMQALKQTYRLSPGTPLWFFQAGWFIDKEFALREELQRYGCSIRRELGQNIILCRIQVGE